MSDNTIKIVLEISVVDGNVKLTTSPPAITAPAEKKQDTQVTDSESLQNDTRRVSSPTSDVVNSSHFAKVAPKTRNNMLHVKIANDIHNMQKAKLSANEKAKPTVVTSSTANVLVQNGVGDELLRQKQGQSYCEVYDSSMPSSSEFNQRVNAEVKILQFLQQQQSQFESELEEDEEEQEENEYEHEKLMNETLAREQQRLAEALAQAIPINHNSLFAIQQSLRAQEAERLRQATEMAIARRAEAIVQNRALPNVQQQMQQLSIGSQPASQMLDLLQQQMAVQQLQLRDDQTAQDQYIDEYETMANDGLAEAQQSLARALAQAIPISNDSLLAVQQQLQASLQQQAQAQAQQLQQAQLLSLLLQSQKASNDQRAAQAILDASLAAQSAARHIQQQEEERFELFRQQFEQTQREIDAIGAEVQAQLNNQKQQQN